LIELIELNAGGVSKLPLKCFSGEDERDKILRGWEDISSSTCIRFRQRSSEENFLFVEWGPEEEADPRCSSQLGYQDNQKVILK